MLVQDLGSNTTSQRSEPARRIRRKRTKSAPSAPPDINAVRFREPRPPNNKPIMPGSLFPRSPTPSLPRERESATTQDPFMRENRPQRRKRAESVPEPPVLQNSTPSQDHQGTNLPSPPRAPSPITVKLERSPSVEIIPPPTPLYRRGDKRPLPPRTPRSIRTDHSALEQHPSPARIVPAAHVSQDTHVNQAQIQPQFFQSTSDLAVLATPNTSLRRIRTLEEEIQRLRMQVLPFVAIPSHNERF